VERAGYVVVNWEFLKSTLPALTKVDDLVVTLVVCQQKDLDECRRRYYWLRAEAVKSITSKSQEQAKSQDQVAKGGEPNESDFQRYIKEWATQYGLSAEQAQAEVEKWVSEVQQRRDNASDLALAEFYQKHFGKAAELSEQAAQDKIGELENLERKEQAVKKNLTAGIVNDLGRAGNACYNDYRFEEALASYQKALNYALGGNGPGPRSKDVGLLLTAMGDTYDAQGQSGDAIASLRQALEIFEVNPGPESPEIATCLNKLSLLFLDRIFPKVLVYVGDQMPQQIFRLSEFPLSGVE
jgi:tetratricopeptide (TPR) repeat protein